MWQFIKFAIIGAVNTALDIAVLDLLILATGLASGLAFSLFKAISFMVAVGNSYILNKYWTFRDKSHDYGSQLRDFLFISIGGLLVNVGVASLVVNGISPITSIIDLIGSVLGVVGIQVIDEQLIWSQVGAITAVAFSMFWNFFGYKFFVFKKKEVEVDRGA